VASHGLPYRQYQKVFTDGFISKFFNDGGVTRVTNTMLSDDGGYVQLNTNDWWAPAERATHDKSNFYLPTGSVDPFGNVTSIQYDGYGLLPTQVTDPESNVIQSENDYRVLAPWRMTDPNDNRTE
jgi:YD repeat-containing protein